MVVHQVTRVGREPLHVLLSLQEEEVCARFVLGIRYARTDINSKHNDNNSKHGQVVVHQVASVGREPLHVPLSLQEIEGRVP